MGLKPPSENEPENQAPTPSGRGLGLRNWLRLMAVGAVLVVVVAGGSLLAAGRFPFWSPTWATDAAPPAFAGSYQPYEELKPAKPAPDVAFLDADGAAIKLDAYRGRVLLLNFWATWCAPCVKELPALQALQADLGGPEFDVLIVSVDRKGHDVATPFLEDLGIDTLRTAVDAKSDLARALGAGGLPTTFIIDRQGRVRGRLLGDAEWNSDKAKALIRYYIAQG